MYWYIYEFVSYYGIPISQRVLHSVVRTCSLSCNFPFFFLSNCYRVRLSYFKNGIPLNTVKLLNLHCCDFCLSPQLWFVFWNQILFTITLYNIGVNSANLTICIKLYFIVITFGFGLIILFEGGAGHEKQLIKPIRVLNCRRLLTGEIQMQR
jgi:hypothetical protein